MLRPTWLKLHLRFFMPKVQGVGVRGPRTRGSSTTSQGHTWHTPNVYLWVGIDRGIEDLSDVM